MNSILLAQAVKFLAELILGSEVFNHVIGVVQRWDTKEIAGVEKKKGVLSEFEVLGLNLTEAFANLAVELAVAYVGYKAGDNMSPTKSEIIDEVESTTINTLSNTVNQVSNS
jgi:hypothetical protein